MTLVLVLLAHMINVAVAGTVAAAILRDAPGMAEAYGPDTPARRILACVYAAVAGASAAALIGAAFDPDLAIRIGAGLFPLQIVYKTLTRIAIRGAHPVVTANLLINVPLAAATIAIFV